MNLSELIFKRLSADENLQTMLATYAGAPAIFDSEFPADQQEGWEGATQYPRICYRIDMQVNQERSSAGTLYVAMYTDKTSTIIEDIETAVKHCLQDVLMKPAGEAPFCVAWARTESYAIEGKEVWCKEMAFDILEYSEQFSTDPDPVLAVAAYIKKIFPETIVLGIDNVGDFVETSKTPVFYCRLAHLAHTTGHCMNTISWFIGKIAVHLIYPGAGTRLKTLAYSKKLIRSGYKSALLHWIFQRQGIRPDEVMALPSGVRAFLFASTEVWIEENIKKNEKR